MNAQTSAEHAVMELVPTEAQPVALAQQSLALSANSPAAMMLAAMERGATLEQVEKMMDLQERFERREAEKAFFAALSGLRSEAIEVVKRKRVHFVSQKGTTDYKHAELSDVIEAAQPAMAKHGLSHRWDVKQEARRITVTCIVSHAMGHSINVSLTADPDDTGNKNPIQQVASTITYLERHTLKAALGLSEKGDDDDGKGSNGGKNPITVTRRAAGAIAQESLDALHEAGRVASLEGTKQLNAWWGGLSEAQRTALTPSFAGLRAAARAADQKGAN
jgi:ERF superfamily